jgi:ABC-type bacteriocin/lantibiotic exporter with double-glycine peptidase domain
VSRVLRNCFRITILMSVCCTAASASAQAGAWLDVPFVAQQKDGCGAAVISMVMQYWQLQQGVAETSSARPEIILHELYSSSSRGVYTSAMVGYFQKYGFRILTFAGQWQDFARELQKGRPLIVGLKPEGSESLHYVVVVGEDTEGQLLLLNDPARRKLLKEDRAVFEREWKATDNWTLLVVPQSSTR